MALPTQICYKIYPHQGISCQISRLSQVWWVKCILRYISPSEGVERTTKTQRTQRLIDPMSIKLITQNLEEPGSGEFQLKPQHPNT